MFGDFPRLGFDWAGFSDLNRLMDDLMGDFGFADVRSAPVGAFPKVNVGETPDAVNVYAFAPGVNRDDLDISVQGNALIMHGKRKLEPEGDQEQRTWYRQERFGGEFTRAISLPDYVDPEAVEARLKDGMLTVQLRKRQEVQPRRVEIQSA